MREEESPVHGAKMAMKNVRKIKIFTNFHKKSVQTYVLPRIEYFMKHNEVSMQKNFSICIDMKDHTYKVITSNQYVESLNNETNAFAFLHCTVLSHVEPKYQKELLDWIRPEVILLELYKNAAVSKDFYSDEAKGWYRSFFTIGDRNADGSISQVIYGCLDITEDKERELKTQTMSAQQQQILKSLSGIFYSLHLLDLVEDTVTVYNAKNEVEQIVNKTTGASIMMRQIMNTVVTEAYLQDALFFTDLKTVANRMKGKNMISAEFVGKNVGWFDASFIALETDDEGKPTKVIYTTRVIDKEKQREEKLLQESNTDQLTGFYNRRAYEDFIHECENKTLSDASVYASIDINGLKVVNDTIGHDAGDELILGACDCMRHCIDPYGRIYRTGGDEFIALINANDEQLEKIKKDLEEACNKWSGTKVKSLALSCGFVSVKEHPEMTLHEISVLADKRMYEAKSKFYRKNGVDRRGQRDAHVALCALYTKILKINLAEDSYQIVNMDQEEQTKEKGFAEKISAWFSDFGTSGQVHPDDLPEYLAKTDLGYIHKYFEDGGNLLRFFYRRRYGDNFKKVMMEMIPANDDEGRNQNLFLYVKEID